MRQLKWTLPFLISLSLLLVAGCEPSIEGEEGNLVFSYETGPLSARDDAPLAKDARLYYTARTPGDEGQSVSITSATSSDKNVVEVSADGSGRFEAVGMGTGTSEISVQADGPEGATKDKFDIEVVEVDGMEISNLCTEDQDAAAVYLTDSDVDLRYRMTNGGSTVAGFGYYPVESADSNMATVGDADTMGFLRVQTGSSSGETTLDSQVDETSYELDIVEPGDITGVMMYYEDLNIPVPTGGTQDFFVLPTVDNVLGITEATPVCQASNTMNVTSDTPGICSVEVTQDPDRSGDILNPYEPRAVRVTGESTGECKYTVTFPDANAGAGVSKQFTTEVAEDSDDGDTGNGSADAG